MQALALSLTCTATVSQAQQSHITFTAYGFWAFSTAFSRELYENRTAFRSTQNSTLQCKASLPEGGFSWFLLHDLKQSGQQTSLPITDKTPKTREETTVWLGGQTLRLVQLWSAPKDKAHSIPYASWKFTDSSATGRALNGSGKLLQYLQHDLGINPRRKKHSFSPNILTAGRVRSWTRWSERSLLTLMILWLYTRQPSACTNKTIEVKGLQHYLY